MSEPAEPQLSSAASMSRPSRRVALWLRRAGWLALIWAASVSVLAIAALVMRLVMSAAGLTR